MPKLHLVWNTARNECVGFLDKAAADWTAKGGRSRHPYGAVPTIGEAFRESYGEDADRLPQSEIDLPTLATS